MRISTHLVHLFPMQAVEGKGREEKNTHSMAYLFISLVAWKHKAVSLAPSLHVIREAISNSHHWSKHFKHWGPSSQS